ncbi:MAG: RNA-binding protein [Hadesarchaea archaeon]|nr:MAG: RNA-binding protein [Hadesarchaea archaeon]
MVVTMEEIRTGTFVVPGTFLSTVEEFLPGEGVYEEGGKVYASCAGLVLVDLRTRKISVIPRSSPPVLKRGDIVLGEVEDVGPQRVEITIGSLRRNENRQLPPPRLGILHVSKVSKGYVRDLEKKFRVGDIVRAKVGEVGREIIQLSTAEDDLGVILAKCFNCNTTLKVENLKMGKLKCPVCKRVEFRKLANDYGKGDPWGE